jgi:hypothetical protein
MRIYALLCIKWYWSQWNLNTSYLVLLHQKSKTLLEALKTYLPDRVGGAKVWNFEKAHRFFTKYVQSLCEGGQKLILAKALNMLT